MQDVRESVQRCDVSVIPPTESYLKSRKTSTADGVNGGPNNCGLDEEESHAEISEEQDDELAVIQEIALSRVKNQAQVIKFLDVFFDK